MTHATLSLNFTPQTDRTALHVLRQDPPWRALRAFHNPSGEALIHLHNVSGGILGGDELHLEANLQPRAQAQITSVSATRIYRSRADLPAASQFTRFHVGKDALLEYLPETVIPFANSRFEQTSEIHLDQGAGLICWETLSAGRIASGERWVFHHVSVNTAIYAAARPIAIERYSLHPRLTDLCSPARFGNYLYSTTMYVCRTGHPAADWLTLENELNSLGTSLSSSESSWGASALISDGVVVRGMAKNAHRIAAGLQAMWHKAKQDVWGRQALPPRKIY
jgi:urease accessory protein